MGTLNNTSPVIKLVFFVSDNLRIADVADQSGKCCIGDRKKEGEWEVANKPHE